MNLFTILTILQETLPVRLGTPGAVLLTLIAVISAALNAYQWRKSTQATQWQGAALAYKEELVAVRDRCTRLEHDNTEQAKSLAVLKARTDLSSLERLNLDADKRNQEVHERIVITLNTLMENNATRHAQLSAVLMELTGAVQGLGQQMANEFELHRGALANTIRDAKRSRREPGGGHDDQ